MYDEVYDLVKTPLVFINSWDFQWAQNVECMTKLTKESDETGNSHKANYIKNIHEYLLTMYTYIILFL